MCGWRAGVVAILCAGAVYAAPPVELTAEQDHRRLLELLGIASLRGGADGMNPQAPNAANRDEPLPRMPLPTQPTPSDPFEYPAED